MRLALVSLLLAGSAASAAVGTFGSFVQIDTDSSAPTWYDLQAFGSDLTNFQGANLGTFNTELSNTLTITGAEILTFKNSGGDVTGAILNWRVWSGTPSGTFSTTSLGFGANSTSTTIANGATFSGPGDQAWRSTGLTLNPLAGLTPGNYSLELFIRGTSNQGDFFANNGGSNYIATFTVIPEPSAYAAAFGLLTLGLVALRRRRKA